MTLGMIIYRKKSVGDRETVVIVSMTNLVGYIMVLYSSY